MLNAAVSKQFPLNFGDGISPLLLTKVKRARLQNRLWAQILMFVLRVSFLSRLSEKHLKVKFDILRFEAVLCLYHCLVKGTLSVKVCRGF
jgi:hypothetical protein